MYTVLALHEINTSYSYRPLDTVACGKFPGVPYPIRMFTTEEEAHATAANMAKQIPRCTYYVVKAVAEYGTVTRTVTEVQKKDL
jgi:hypothetical protein